MTARYLLDTNICIYIRQKRPPAVGARFGGMAQGEVGLSVISYGELALGVEKSRDREAHLRGLLELITLIPVLPLPPEAGTTYGAIRASLQKRGEVIGGNDIWIAAHALAADMILVTNKESEFKQVSGLKIENWTQ